MIRENSSEVRIGPAFRVRTINARKNWYVPQNDDGISGLPFGLRNGRLLQVTSALATSVQSRTPPSL
jgi:hypothetical protein